MIAVIGEAVNADACRILGDFKLVGDVPNSQKGYMKGYKPGVAIMTEKSDETKEIAKPKEAQPAPEAAQRSGVIGDTNKQADWRTTQLAHMLGQEESATDLFYRPGQAKQPKQKFEFFDSTTEESQSAKAQNESEQVLISASLVPNDPKLEAHTQVPPVKDESTEPRIAQAFEGYMPPPTLMPDFAIKAGIQVLAATEKPLEGCEKQLMASITESDPQAWEHAVSKFPWQLTPAAIGIMKAYTLNEIAHYDRFDWIDDILAAGGKLSDTPARKAEHATLGLSQISPKGVREFESKYPQFKQFLTEKGYAGPGHEVKALLDPQCVPMIVAAKTATLVEDLHKHGIKNPTHEQLAYAYNPDVYSYSDGHGGKIYKALYQGEVKISGLFHHEQQKEYYAKEPGVIAASKHIHNVMAELKKLENKSD